MMVKPSWVSAFRFQLLSVSLLCSSRYPVITMKLFLFGHRGYVGSWIDQYFSEKGWEIVRCDVDVTNQAAVRQALEGVTDSIVINATGKTGKPNVDWCEDHRLETTAVNVNGAINVCQMASEQGNYVIQVGSGCIFSGNGEYAFTEEDEPNFFGSFYSQTKAIAEGALKEIPNVCILRIRMPLQGSESPKNLLNKLLRYDKILSVPNSVTIMEDLMPFIERVIEKRVTGPLNAVNPGAYEHRDLLEHYREIVDPSRHFEYITLEEFAGMTKAERSNCVLSTKKCEELGIVMPAVKERIRDILEMYKESL